MDITSYDIYAKKIIELILRHSPTYTGDYLTKLANMSIVELEKELYNVSGQHFSELSNDRVKL